MLFCLCRILGTFRVDVLTVKVKLVCLDNSCLEHNGIKGLCAFPSTEAARATSSLLIDKLWVRTRVALGFSTPDPVTYPKIHTQQCVLLSRILPML